MTAIRTITLDNGITVENAIHRVSEVNIGYKNKMHYTVSVHVSEGLPKFHSFVRECVYLGGNVIEECYADLNKSDTYEED